MWRWFFFYFDNAVSRNKTPKRETNCAPGKWRISVLLRKFDPRQRDNRRYKELFNGHARLPGEGEEKERPDYNRTRCPPYAVGNRQAWCFVKKLENLYDKVNLNNEANFMMPQKEQALWPSWYGVLSWSWILWRLKISSSRLWECSSGVLLYKIKPTK